MTLITALLIVLLTLLIIVIFLIFLRLYKFLGKANEVAEQLNSQTLPLVNSRLKAIDLAPILSLIRGLTSGIKVAHSAAGVFSEFLKTLSVILKGRKKKTSSAEEVREMSESG